MMIFASVPFWIIGILCLVFLRAIMRPVLASAPCEWPYKAILIAMMVGCFGGAAGGWFCIALALVTR